MNSNHSNTSTSHSTSVSAVLRRVKACSCALACASLLWAGSASAQVPVTDGAHISTQIGQWVRNYQQWQQQFQNMTLAKLQNITGNVSLNALDRAGNLNFDNLDTANNNYLNSLNNNCLRQKAEAQTLCTARRNLEMGRANEYRRVLQEIAKQNDKVNSIMARAPSDNQDTGKMMSIQTELQKAQNDMLNIYNSNQTTLKAYDEQINFIKAQQAELARVVLSGRPDSVGAVTQAVAIQGAFNAIKSTTSNDRTY